MSKAFTPLVFPRSERKMTNRIMLSPMTNTQSHEDGRLSEEEQVWLCRRAEGGFGLVMTCASHVQPVGKGFRGQLGCWSDDHVEGLTGLASALRERGALSALQIQHSGCRAPAKLIGTTPVSPSGDEETGARALSGEEVEQLIEDFVAAAERADRAGFDAVELHGAHGYLLCQFLSTDYNRREDEWGGDLAGRSRIFFEIVRRIRERCRDDLLIGVRLSPERFGMRLGEVLELSQQLIDGGQVDFLDLSLWDCFKEPEEDEFKGRSLMDWCNDLERRDVRVGYAGRIRKPADVDRVLDAGADFLLIGRSAILHHDYPQKMQQDPDFQPVKPPVSAEYLRGEGLGDAFIDYLRKWQGFVAD